MNTNNNSMPSEWVAVFEPILFYLRKKNRQPYGAVAMRKVGGMIHFAASMCHENDRWNSHVAKDKTLGRLQSEKHRLELAFGPVGTDDEWRPSYSLKGLLRHSGLFSSSHPDSDDEMNQKVFEREIEYLLFGPRGKTS